MEVEQLQDSPGIEAWRPAALQLGSVLLGVLIHTLWPVEIPLSVELERIATILMLGLGASIIALSFREFYRVQTSVRPDRGANALIRTGPFAYSRNPLLLRHLLRLVIREVCDGRQQEWRETCGAGLMWRQRQR